MSEKKNGKASLVIELLKEWNRKGSLPMIEKDLLLENLRAVYSEILTARIDNRETETSARDNMMNMEMGKAEGAKCDTPSDKRSYSLEMDMDRDKCCGEPEGSVPQPSQWAHGQVDEILPSTGERYTPELIFNSETQVLEEVPGPVSGTDSLLQMPAEENPGGLSSSDKRKLLYGEEIADPDQTEENIIPAVPAPEPDSSFAEGGEALYGNFAGNGDKTIGDAYADAASQTNVADAVASAPISSLRQGIGINDKFLMLRDLFDGNLDKYEQAIDMFDSFSDLNDALVYIYENFDWNPETEGVKVLMDALTRKLS